ncbi:MAG: preprotein translocase subunit SecE [bacterium]|nr:preprotein translocase subunit SecE [bacterium]
MVKKEKKQDVKKKEKTKKVKKESFLKSVISELKKVHWPDKKYILKYTIVTLVFVIVLSVFFYLISALMSFVKVWLA